MAQFLNTTGISYQLEIIIKNAEDRLWLISPFLKVNQRIRQHLEDADRLRIDARVIYGKNELQPEENIWLESMSSIRTMFCKDLHAKCYLNEKEALLTSMNLYEFSQVNNYEMGILVSRKEEPYLYDEIDKECRRIIRASEEIRVSVERVPAVETDVEPPVKRGASANASPTQSKPKTGFCIRCKTNINASPVRPYCSNCYRSWSAYKNADYEEKYCHTCGSEHKATLTKPVCFSCYRKYKDVLEFSTN